MKFLFVFASLLFSCHFAVAQEPIISETTPPPTPRPKPKVRPQPSFVKPRLLWRTQIGRIDGTPCVQDEDLYIGANGNLVSLDIDGHIQWTTEIGPVLGTPACDEKLVYVGTTRGFLYALDRKSGTPIWKFVTDNSASILTTPTPMGDRIIFEATDNNVYALSTRNGQLRWKMNRADGSLGYSSPLARKDALFVAGETTLYSLDPAAGTVAWKAFLGGKSQSTPVTDGSNVFVSGDGTGLNALSQKDGSLSWTFKGKSNGDWFGTPLLANGTLFVGTYRRFAYALDADNGRYKWSARLPGSAIAQPAIDARRSTVYFASTTFADNPTLTALDARTGKHLWEYPLGYIGGSPVISGDRLFVGAMSGYLYAFSLR